MEENQITLTGAGPFFDAWKQDFVQALEHRNLKPIVGSDNNAINITSLDQNCQIMINQNKFNLDLHIYSNRQSSRNSGSCACLCIMMIGLMLVLFWSHLIPFNLFVIPFSVNPIVIVIIILVFFTVTAVAFSKLNIGEQVARIAEETWQRVQSKITSTEALGPKTLAISPRLPHSEVTENPAALGRPSDESYLLSMEAGKVAARPALTVSQQRKSEMRDRDFHFCPYCGTEQQAGARFCVKCGRTVTDIEDTTQLGIPLDEEYLLSREAAQAAATPSLPARSNGDLQGGKGHSRYCSQCGARSQTRAKFCENCGADLTR
ncbi:MAG TPA: zinc-ribbon domain-containing protein [Candidatus Lokiarchaeia archaeon]|nr:zinc-ribbon domain-containing protein [Candidatus Lokiarchaeia archaeon]